MKRRLPWVLAALVIQGTAIYLVVQSGREATERALSAWEPTAPIALATLPRLGDREGRDVFRPGRPAVVYFWATWCEPCVRHLPETLNIVRALADPEAGVETEVIDVWLVARDTAWNAVAKHFGGEVPRAVVLDRAGRLGDALGVSALPTSFLLDATGRIVARNLDHLADAEAIRAALAKARSR